MLAGAAAVRVCRALSMWKARTSSPARTRARSLYLRGSKVPRQGRGTRTCMNGRNQGIATNAKGLAWSCLRVNRGKDTADSVAPFAESDPTV